MTEIPVTCRDECGRAATETQASQQGWSWLSINRSWRCPNCCRALRDAASMAGTADEGGVDTLPPGSRGALAKETASSIAAPTVKA